MPPYNIPYMPLLNPLTGHNVKGFNNPHELPLSSWKLTTVSYLFPYHHLPELFQHTKDSQ